MRDDRVWTRGGETWWCRHMHKRYHDTQMWWVRRNPLDLRYVQYGWTTRVCKHPSHVGRI